MFLFKFRPAGLVAPDTWRMIAQQCRRWPLAGISGMHILVHQAPSAVRDHPCQQTLLIFAQISCLEPGINSHQHRTQHLLEMVQTVGTQQCTYCESSKGITSLHCLNPPPHHIRNISLMHAFIFFGWQRQCKCTWPVAKIFLLIQCGVPDRYPLQEGFGGGVVLFL